ncbi:MAG: hypothetical protein CL872_05970 [Dehalococcoidaceae bacterium]|nr:hypothetical protein [Dehalococcoidaceae bacterium]|tara:strand:- start:191 stop:1171 length:981 start_codon:yes stop_codon:yes gene_type:complete
MKKIRTAFIYKASNPYMSKKAWATTYYHFFFNALNRNENLEMCYFSGEEKFDVTSLRGKFDIILLWENHPWGSPDELTGIDNLDIPVICRVNDYHDAKIKGKLAYHEKYKIDHYFGYMPESYFYKYYPKNFRYKVIIYGVEKKLYENLTPFEKRIKNKILCSGATARNSISFKLKDMFRGTQSMWKHYKLRTLCTELPYVDYTPTLQHEYINDKYPLLLMKYAASIAADTVVPVVKFWENPAAGCLTFMEITQKNQGQYLGFKNNEHVIFVDEKNYKNKFSEYLSDPLNPKWNEIAKNGYDFTMRNLTNDTAANSLVELFKEYVIK